MFVKVSKREKWWKVYQTVYLAEGYRDKITWKVKHRHHSAIKWLTNEQIIWLKQLFSKKNNQDISMESLENLTYLCSKEYWNVAVFSKIFDNIFWKIISKKYIKEIKSMTINRIFEPKSRNWLNNWLKQVDLPIITKQSNLYEAIDYLENNQEKIEKELFNKRKEEDCELMLYDITSTYFEWQAVQMAKYGYSRDHRSDKLQVNIWLVTDSKWCPVSVEILEWNIVDKSTIQDKIDTLKKRFGIKEITFIFDRWMKSKVNLKYIEEEWFDYITALNHSELKKKSEGNKWIQQSLFDKENLSEFTIEGKKYVLSYNPSKGHKDKYDRDILISKTEKKLLEIQKFKRNYEITTLQNKISKSINKYRCEKYITYRIEKEIIDGKEYGKLIFEKNIQKIEYDEKYDWFYMVESTRNDIEWKELEKKYKSLQLVEKAFDYTKNLIEIRPIFHWKDKRVKWHIFMCFMSYYLLYKFKEKVKYLLEDHTLDNLLTELKSVTKWVFSVDNIVINKISKLNDIQTKIFNLYEI